MTSRTRFSAVAILVCALCAMQANAQPAATTQSADPMLQKVLGMAPVLINSDRTITEFAADGWIDTPRAGRLRFRIGYAAPNRCSLIVYHDFDDTPLLFYADGKGWVYDGRNSQAILLTRAQGLFSVGIVGGQHVFEMAMTSFKPGREPHDVLNVDIKSLFSGAAVQIAQTGEYTYSLRSVSEDGMRHDAEVNVSRSTAFVSLEMTPKGASAPFFALTKIVLNEPIEAGRYRRPDMSRVIGRAKAGEAELDAWARPEIFDDVMLTWAYRRAIYEPNLRPTLERFYGKVDWNNARKQDRATTSVFREIVEKSTTRRTTPQQP